ncbi:MAG TPA: hypothetical protein VFL98_03760 [Candidatus Paceibacterota bacterium]|nr:hypothetical protein [Candidatus Paceibacterota bacterium]
MRFFSSLTLLRENRFDPLVIRHVTDALWYGTVRASFVLVGCMLAYGGWQLWLAQHEEHDAADAAAAPLSIDRDQLRSVLETYQQRHVQYDGLVAHPAAIVDPAK